MQIGLILLALAFPLLELAVLIKVGQSLGVWQTLALLVASGAIGVLVIRSQGLAAARRAMDSMEAGRPPLEPVADSVMLMLAGGLLLLPGLISDAAGFALLVPPLRKAFARWCFVRLVGAAEVQVETHEWRSPGGGGPPPPPGATRRAPDGGIVIEGEWERIEEPKPGTARPGETDKDRPS